MKHFIVLTILLLGVQLSFGQNNNNNNNQNAGNGNHNNHHCSNHANQTVRDIFRVVREFRQDYLRSVGNASQQAQAVNRATRQLNRIQPGLGGSIVGNLTQRIIGGEKPRKVFREFFRSLCGAQTCGNNHHGRGLRAIQRLVRQIVRQFNASGQVNATLVNQLAERLRNLNSSLASALEPFFARLINNENPSRVFCEVRQHLIAHLNQTVQQNNNNNNNHNHHRRLIRLIKRTFGNRCGNGTGQSVVNNNCTNSGNRTLFRDIRRLVRQLVRQIRLEDEVNSTILNELVVKVRSVNATLAGQLNTYFSELRNTSDINICQVRKFLRRSFSRAFRRNCHLNSEDSDDEAEINSQNATNDEEEDDHIEIANQPEEESQDEPSENNSNSNSSESSEESNENNSQSNVNSSQTPQVPAPLPQAPFNIPVQNTNRPRK